MLGFNLQQQHEGINLASVSPPSYSLAESFSIGSHFLWAILGMGLHAVAADGNNLHATCLHIKCRQQHAYLSDSHEPCMQQMMEGMGGYLVLLCQLRNSWLQVNYKRTVRAQEHDQRGFAAYSILGEGHRTAGAGVWEAEVWGGCSYGHVHRLCEDHLNNDPGDGPADLLCSCSGRGMPQVEVKGGGPAEGRDAGCKRIMKMASLERQETLSRGW